MILVKFSHNPWQLVWGLVQELSYHFQGTKGLAQTYRYSQGFGPLFVFQQVGQGLFLCYQSAEQNFTNKLDNNQKIVEKLCRELNVWTQELGIFSALSIIYCKFSRRRQNVID